MDFIYIQEDRRCFILRLSPSVSGFLRVGEEVLIGYVK
jgi:hypothetical protein